MIKLGAVFVVEGRYDRHRIKALFDVAVFETSGFGIFKDREKLALLRRMAEGRGIIVLTDADGAGQVIRGFLKGAIGSGKVYQAYIPAVKGKERRKRAPGKAGLLGVEGMTDEVIIEAVRRTGVMEGEGVLQGPAITKADLYALGLSGRESSAEKRRALCVRLDLPPSLSAQSLLEVLNLITDHQGLTALLMEE